MAGINLLAAIIIYWNTARLDEAVEERESEGLAASAEYLAYILLTGEYRWNKKDK